MTDRRGSATTQVAATELFDTSATETSVKSAETATTVGSDESVNDLELTVIAPALVNSYSQFEISVVAEEEVVDTQIISDRFVVLSATKQSVVAVSPIVQQSETIDYSIDVTVADGRSKRVFLQMEVVLYEHDVPRTRHLNPADLEGTTTEDYAVFNFGFETVFVNERYSETYCYPTVNDCNELDGSFTADAHNMMVGDFNGDGHQDLVVGWVIFPHTLDHKERSTVRVYLNDGAGRLIADPAIYASGAPPERNMSYRLVVDDFNQDGVDDIFAGSQGLLKLLPTGERINDMDPHVLLLSRDGKLFDASDTIDYRGTRFFAHDASSGDINGCLLYTSPSPRDGLLSRMPSSA